MKKLNQRLRDHLHEGTVIPAHPLALDASRKPDWERQKQLTRYYLASKAGGIAIGVHTTQFEIRDHGTLFTDLLKFTMDTIGEFEDKNTPFLKIAGVCGDTEQAMNEAGIASDLGYDLALVSLAGLDNWSNKMLINHIAEIGNIIPVFGFYLQPSVGGRMLPYDFWRQIADIPSVEAIKIAPFNRYQTLDVVKAVCHSDRRDEIALYTGNDDSIIVDLLTDFSIEVSGSMVKKSIVGGLLGQWAVWTNAAVELLREIKSIKSSGSGIPPALLTKSAQLTDANAAIFDAENDFKGCIPGIHYVLYQEGLMSNIHCLNPAEKLSPGQKERIEKVQNDYPWIVI